MMPRGTVRVLHMVRQAIHNFQKQCEETLGIPYQTFEAWEQELLRRVDERAAHEIDFQLHENRL